MGRGRGAAEHDESSRVAAVDDPKGVLDRTRRVVDDSDDEEEEGVMPEKAIEQVKQEQEAAWREFHYPWWVHKLVYVFFVICLANMAVTLTNYHGTHSWRRPVDLYPINKRPGGWGDDDLRYTGAVMGLISACFSFVFAPSAGKFQFMFVIAFLSAFFHAYAFGKDLDQFNTARGIDFCQDEVQDMHVRKFICRYDRFIATVIFDCIASVFMFGTSFFLLYQANTGVVTKRKVFNEQTKSWEEIVLAQNDEYWMAFPPVFKKQRPVFNGVVFIAAAINITVIVLSVTQSTLDIYQAKDQEVPIYNTGRRLPVDIYIYEGAEATHGGLGTGGWPTHNFNLRFWANMISLVVLAFLIQWRRDGRTMQLYVMFGGGVGALLYVAALIYDWIEFVDAETIYCRYARANNMICYNVEYEALLVLTGVCGACMTAFSLASFLSWIQQAKRPINWYHGAPAGWFFFGGSDSEWAHEKRMLEAQQ